MSRNQIIAAGGSFLLIVFALSQVSLYSSLFDYRFGFVALGAGILGLSAGSAINHWLAAKPVGPSGATWIAASGLSAEIFVAASLIVPFGTVASFLFLIAMSATPFAFWAMGVAVLYRGHNAPIQRLVWAVVVGAIAGVLASLWLLDLTGGPLQMSVLVAVALAVLAMTTHGRRLAAALSVAGFAVIGLAGFYGGWDFSSLPRWAHEDGASAKPLYVESMPGPVKRLDTRWDVFSRTDVAARKTADENLLWLYTNGTFSGLMPADRPGAEDSEWLKKNFPLVTLPLQASQPQSILIVNPGAGLEVRMAADMGVSHIYGMESSLAMSPILEQWRDYHGGLPTRPGIKLAYGDVRGALRRDGERYDQIYLPITQNHVPGWTERGPAETYLYTKEAFKDYWLHLRPGGMLIVLAGEERLYMRSLLMAWEILKEDPVDGDDSLVRHAWGFRVTGVEPLKRPYEYLLMLVKGPATNDLGARVQELSRGMPVIGLFGPGVTARSFFDVRYQPYNILYHPRGLDLARTALRDAMSWHLQVPADLVSATDQRPFFFQIIRGIHPFLKWLLAACVIPLIYIFLFPLAAERRLDHPASGEHPPLPVLLGYFMLLGAGSMLVMVALANQAALLSGYSGLSLALVVGATVLGAGCGAVIYMRSNGSDASRQWHGTAIASAALCGLLYWILDRAFGVIGEWSAILRAMVMGGLAFPTGLLSALLFMGGLCRLSRNLTALFPWALITYGTAAVGGAVLAFWFAQYGGWGTVWIIAAGCYAAILWLGLWLQWSKNREQPEETSLAT